ncbi:MAG: hypothetical protein AAF826_00990 [Pseudomonadota bacterium]
MMTKSCGIATLFGKTTYEGRAEGRIVLGHLFPSRFAYRVARKRSLDQLCDLSYIGFDGLRRTRVDIGPAQPTETWITCDATYTRVAGFSERALRRGQVFPMNLVYSEEPDGFVLTTLTARTVFGSAKLTLEK